MSITILGERAISWDEYVLAFNNENCKQRNQYYETCLFANSRITRFDELRRQCFEGVL